MVIFHSYVSSPKGKISNDVQVNYRINKPEMHKDWELFMIVYDPAAPRKHGLNPRHLNGLDPTPLPQKKQQTEVIHMDRWLLAFISWSNAYLHPGFVDEILMFVS